MTMELAPHYLVDSLGRCFYPLTNPVFGSEGTPTAKAADGWIDVQIRNADGGPGYSHHRSTWYITNEPVTMFAFPQSPVNKVVGYQLKDNAAISLAFPATLTPEEYNERRRREDPDDDDADDSLTYIMYQAIKEEVARDPYLVDVSAMTPMPGDGDENGSWGWEVERTAGLLYGTYYHHLLPGTLYGVKERLAAALSHRYGKYDYFGRRDGFNIDSHGTFEIRRTLEFDVPVFITRSKYGARGQKLRGTEKVRERVPINIEWNQGTRITAKTKAEAIEIYNKVLADLFAWIDSFDVTVCSHCKGNGYTKTNAPKPS